MNPVDWIDEIKNNEEEALTSIYKMYRDDCIYWLQKSYSCTRDEALDIFQSTLVILYDNVKREKLTKLTSDMKSYLMGIAKNKALEMIRTKKKSTYLKPLNSWVDYVNEDQEEAILEEQLLAASKALSRIGDPCKSLLQYYFYQNKNMEEISELMGYKNADTAKNKKYKCLKRLQLLYYRHKD